MDLSPNPPISKRRASKDRTAKGSAVKIAFVVSASSAAFTAFNVKESELTAFWANIAVFVVIVVWRFRAVDELSNAAAVSLHVNKSAFAQGITFFLQSPVVHIGRAYSVLVVIIIG